MISAAVVWETPTRTRTLSPRSACSASAAAASTSLSARRARRQTASPAGQPYLCAAARPVEQGPPERRLKRRDLMRQRGLGVAELGGCPAERTELRHGENGAQLAEANATFDRPGRSYRCHFFILAMVLLILK